MKFIKYYLTLGFLLCRDVHEMVFTRTVSCLRLQKYIQYCLSSFLLLWLSKVFISHFFGNFYNIIGLERNSWIFDVLKALSTIHAFPAARDLLRFFKLLYRDKNNSMDFLPDNVDIQCFRDIFKRWRKRAKQVFGLLDEREMFKYDGIVLVRV